MDVVERTQLRPLIAWTLAGCLAVAMAPWLSGGQEPLAGLISVFALLMGTVLAWRQPAVRQLKPGPLAVSYLALVAWAALSLLWSANRYSSLVWLAGLVGAGLAFRLAYLVAGDDDGWQRIVWLYLVSALAVVAYGGYLYLTSGYDRFTSSFYWPNPAAAYLIPAIFWSFDRWRRGGHWVNGKLAIIFGASFVLTASRAAAAVVLLLLAIYLLCIRPNRRLWITLLFSILGSILIAYGFVYVRQALQPKAVITTPGSRLSPASAGNLQSGSDRIHYLESTINIWVAHPILGTGAGTFADVHPQYQGRVVSASTNAHNAYLQILAELGLLGFLILGWLGFSLVVGTLRGVWQQPKLLALWLGMAGLWLHFGLDIDAQYPALLLLAASLAGALYYQRPSQRSLGWWWPVAAVGVTAVVACTYLSSVWTVRGQAAQDANDYATAAADFQRAHSYGVYDPDVLTAEGINRYTLAKEGEASQAGPALALARAAERADRDDAQHRQLEGRVLELKGDTKGAEAAYREALRLDPYNHPEYSYDLALLEWHEGRIGDALTTADAMLAQYPPAVVANRAADPAIAESLAELAVFEGTVHLQAGDLPAARASSKQALSLDAGDVRAQALAAVLEHLATQQ
jgi:tetratricopeptide (TPR) repeat protein